jgi:Fe-S-cluster containining protein
MEKDPRVAAALAKELNTENWRFRTFLRTYCRLSDARLNGLAKEAGEQAAAQMDCRACGECCRDIVVPLEDDEIAAMAAAATLSETEFRERHVRKTDDYDQAIEAKPCPFQEGNRCTIYESRPSPCRGYPYVGGDIRSRMLGILERAETCPIVFEMLEQLKQRLGFRRLRYGH